MFTDEQLTKVRAYFNQIATELYKMPRASLKALDFVPLQGGVDRWTRWWTYLKITGMGMAKLLTDGSNDLPPTSVAVAEESRQIFSYGNSYGWTEEQVQQWLLKGIALSSEKGAFAKEEIDFKIDDVILNGDTDTSTPGFYQNAVVPTCTIPNDGTGSSTAFSTKTLVQIAASIRAMINAFKTNNADKNGESRIPAEGLDLILPASVYDHLHDTYDTNATKNYLDILKQQFSEEIGAWKKAGALATKGASGTTRAILYKRDQKYLAAIVPMAFYQKQAQEIGFDFSVPCMGRTGGTVVKVPTAMLYADGV